MNHKVLVELTMECAFCGEAYAEFVHRLGDGDLRAVESDEGPELMLLTPLPRGWALAKSGDAYCPACCKQFGLQNARPLAACAWCGAPLFTEAKLCQNCWEEAGRADGGDKLDD